MNSIENISNLEEAINKNVRLKSKIILIVFLVIFLVQLAGISFFYFFPNDIVTIPIHKLILGPVFIGIGLLAEIFLIRYISAKEKSGKKISKLFYYLLAFDEVSFPTLILLYACSIIDSNIAFTHYDILNSPPVLVYFIFILLSALHLDFRLSFFVGFFAAIQYAFLTFQYLNNPKEFAVCLTKSFLFLVGGIISGFVAKTIKNSVSESINAKNDLIHNLDVLVDEKTTEINKQKIEIEQQNLLLSEKNKHITDSISYAKRIQSAILPPESQINNLLPNCFVLYIPKDIVSGDFYFFEKQKDKIIFSSVDCTGHGVPGALMSVVGFNFLYQAVNEKGMTKPSDILKYLDIGVNNRLRQSSSENGVKDGMDLGLCSIDVNTKELQYAGAFNPMYIVSGGILTEIKADKSPIGVNTSGFADEYTNHSFMLKEGDMVYLLTDGYADQFGGPKGKKFKYAQLKEILVKNSTLPVNEQKEKLFSTYESWKGELEQVDDICIIGMRV